MQFLLFSDFRKPIRIFLQSGLHALLGGALSEVNKHCEIARDPFTKRAAAAPDQRSRLGTKSKSKELEDDITREASEEGETRT